MKRYVKSGVELVHRDANNKSMGMTSSGPMFVMK